MRGEKLAQLTLAQVATAITFKEGATRGSGHHHRNYLARNIYSPYLITMFFHHVQPQVAITFMEDATPTEAWAGWGSVKIHHVEP